MVKNLGVNELARFVYPGAVIAAFVLWKHGNASLIPVMISLVFGIIFYSIYRATFWLLTRWILSKTFGIPQYKFHVLVADSIKMPSEVKTITKASACASHVLMQKASPDFL